MPIKNMRFTLILGFALSSFIALFYFLDEIGSASPLMLIMLSVLALVAVSFAVAYDLKVEQLSSLENQSFAIQQNMEEKLSFFQRQSDESDISMNDAMNNTCTSVCQQIYDVMDHMSSLSESVEKNYLSLREMKTQVHLHRSEMASASEQLMQALSVADNMMVVNQAVNSSLVKIPKITAQINLVALNATIEAARAGEVGKGFSVVADEVKKLAAETFEVTKNISKHMEEGSVAAAQANELVGSVVNVMHDTKSMVERNAKTLDEYFDGVDSLKNALESVIQELKQIETTVYEFKSDTPAKRSA